MSAAPLVQEEREEPFSVLCGHGETTWNEESRAILFLKGNWANLVASTLGVILANAVVTRGKVSVVSEVLLFFGTFRPLKERAKPIRRGCPSPRALALQRVFCLEAV